MIKTVGIVGLGLIGGSMAKTVRETTTCRIYACNRSKNIVEQAIAEDVIHGELNKDTLQECDLLILSLYARRNIEYVKENIAFMKKGAVLVDCTGIRAVCVRSCRISVKRTVFILSADILWRALRSPDISILSSVYFTMPL